METIQRLNRSTMMFRIVVILFFAIGLFAQQAFGQAITQGSAPGTKVVLTQGAAGQTANLQEWNVNGGAAVGTMSSTGVLTATGLNVDSVKIVNGTQGAGKVLTSDANGKASWDSLTASSLVGSVSPNFSCLSVIGAVTTGTEPFSIAVSGNYAYVVNFASYTFQVINISNPVLPTVAGSVSTGTGGEPASVAVSGSYAYVVNYNSSTFQVINISNPAAPAVAGSVGTGSGPTSVAVSGNYAYVVNQVGNTLQVINISNHASPAVVGTVSTGIEPSSVAVSGNYAYVANFGSATLQVINISNPSSPTTAGSVGTGSGPESVAVSGNYAYVANITSNTLQVIDVSNPVSPAVVASVGTGIHPSSVAVSGNYAYVVNEGSKTMQVINISNPLSPVVAGSISTGNQSNSVAVSGNYAYVTNTNGSNAMLSVLLSCNGGGNTAVSVNPFTGTTVATPLAWTGSGSNIYNNNGGNVGIGTATPGYLLTVNGQPAANGYTAFTNYSDARLKTNIKDIDNSLDKIMKLRPVTFQYNKDYLKLYNDPSALTKTYRGFIAQDIKEVFPEMVGKTKGTDYYDLNLSNLPVYLVKAMQEQQMEIAELKAENERLKTENEARMKAMEEKIALLMKAAGK